VAVIAGIGTVGVVILGALRDPLIGQSADYVINNPIGIEWMPIPEEHPLGYFFLILILAGLLGATAGIIFRFRRSRGVERQQLKWFFYTGLLLPLIIVFENIPVIDELLLGFILIAIPASIGIAVLRYRLYDIDLIIRRTLVYGLLTALLALVYFVAVTLIGNMLTAASGQQSTIAVVISTLTIAALFNPLRKRVQEFIDRRFYRKRYDIEKIIEAFSSSLRDQVEIEQLTSRLTEVVKEALQPVQLSIWLRPIKKNKYKYQASTFQEHGSPE
jgi:hypothetical protein